MEKQIHLYKKLISITAMLAFVVIVLGAATRVFDAGMSCPDWPMCYGLYVPFPAPEGGYVVADQSYVWWQVALEWTHRLMAAITGLVLLAAAYIAFKCRKEKTTAAKFAFVPFILLMIQVKLGGITVWLSNINWSVALHLGCAMLFFGSLLVWRRLVARPSASKRMNVPSAFYMLAWLFAVNVFLTMIMGAMTSSSYAGGVCGGLFDCQGSWFPTDALQQMHMVHRFLALASVAAVLAFASKAYAMNIPELKKTSKGLLILVGVQIALGIFTLYSFSHFAEFYTTLSIVHLAWGTLVFMASIGTLSKLHLGVEGSFHDS